MQRFALLCTLKKSWEERFRAQKIQSTILESWYLLTIPPNYDSSEVKSSKHPSGKTRQLDKACASSKYRALKMSR